MSDWNGSAIVSVLVLVITPCVCRSAPKERAAPERGFISSRPAENWSHGLLSGNGTIGANVFGQPTDETIIFTHERLFLPGGAPTIPASVLGTRLDEVRKLIDRGKGKDAAKLIYELSGQDGFKYPEPLAPAFDLSIQTTPKGKVKDYLRSVNFATGEATVQWSDDTGAYQRRLFVSRADGVAVLSITGPKPGSVSCRLKLKPREPSKTIRGWKSGEAIVKNSKRVFLKRVAHVKSVAGEFGLSFSNTFSMAYPGSIQSLEGLAHVHAENAAVTQEGDTFVIKGADRVLVLVDIRLHYAPERTLLERMKKNLAQLATDGYEGLLERHERIHGELFNRMRLDIGGGSDRGLTSEQLIAKSSRENISKALVEKQFDACRYNIISSTGELPPTLQGIWGGTYVPIWANDYTHNGNLNSALASMHMANMPELMRSYTSYMQSILPDMRTNAKSIFGARGFQVPFATSTHGYNTSVYVWFPGLIWVGGAPWSAHFFYDHYLYTGDREFLAKEALPYMEEALLFFEDYLYEGPDGKYVFNPGQSPENAPSNMGDQKSQATFNATMDIAAVKELLRNTIAASRELNVNQGKIPVWQAMLNKMPDYMISKDGYFKEWLTPTLADNFKHRHASHLYPLYYGLSPEFENNPELREAAKRSIDRKLLDYWERGASMSFGLVQLGQAATTLGEGELAYRCLGHLANRFWFNNMASTHDHKLLLNTDISGGMPSVIITMLTSSSLGKIQLLPALPKAWPTGAIDGILCRGQVEIRRLQWDRKRILVRLLSAKEQTVTIETPANIADITVQEGQASVRPADRKSCRLSLPAGRKVALRIELQQTKNY